MPTTEVTIRTHKGTITAQRELPGELLSARQQDLLAEGIQQLDSIRAELVEMIGYDPAEGGVRS